MREEKQSQSVLRFLILSVLVHLLLCFGFYEWSTRVARVAIPSKPANTEVVFVRSQDVLPAPAAPQAAPQAREIADISKPKIEKAPAKARFASQYDSTVPEETVARKTPQQAKLDVEESEDLGKKSAPPSPEKNAAAPAEPAPAPEKTSSEKISLSDLQVKPQDFKEALKPENTEAPSRPDFQNLRRPPGLTGLGSETGDRFAHDFFPNIKIGDKTYLNAQAFPDIQYFTRLKRVFRLRFNPHDPLVQYFSSHPVNQQQINVVMGMEVTPNGQLEKIFVVKSSGIPSYDAEALATVQESAPFAAPPEKVRDKDGRLRMTWNFLTYL